MNSQIPVCASHASVQQLDLVWGTEQSTVHNPNERNSKASALIRPIRHPFDAQCPHSLGLGSGELEVWETEDGAHWKKVRPISLPEA